MSQRRWIELFSHYDCEIRYYPRKANVVADALSRKERVKPRRVRAMCMTIQSSVKYKILEAYMEASKVENAPTEILCGLDQQIEKKEDGGLYFMNRIWVSLVGSVRTLIMDEAHASRYFVHPRSDKMYYDLRDMYWWPGIKKDIATYVSKFLSCSKVKTEHQRPSGLLQHPEIPEWKCYADNRHKPLDFSVGDQVLLKVSPWKSVVRFVKKGKLAPSVHDTFHVSNLKKYLADANLHVLLEDIKVDKTLRFIKEPVEIIDREDEISLMGNVTTITKADLGRVDEVKTPIKSSNTFMKLNLCGKMSRWTMSVYTTIRSPSIEVIMEYLVKVNKKARILELKRRYLKITVLTTNTSYPSRKSCRICAYTSPETTKETRSNTPFLARIVHLIVIVKGAVVAMELVVRQFYALQYHPERVVIVLRKTLVMDIVAVIKQKNVFFCFATTLAPQQEKNTKYGRKIRWMMNISGDETNVANVWLRLLKVFVWLEFGVFGDHSHGVVNVLLYMCQKTVSTTWFAFIKDDEDNTFPAFAYIRAYFTQINILAEGIRLSIIAVRSHEKFDEGKRSCKKRLHGHNRRRRKLQPDTSRAAMFLGHKQITLEEYENVLKGEEESFGVEEV
ncbi:putative reverse transcriptase domain-containing protein [Tanacetum coccineum]